MNPRTLRRPALVLALLSATATAQDVVEYVKPRPVLVGDVLTLTGSVNTPMHAALSPQTAGLVERIHVDAGDSVERGQRLLQLDAKLARLDQQRAEAAVAEADTRLREARRLRDEAESLAAKGSLPQSLYQTRRAEAELAAAALAGLVAERDVQAERVAQHTLKAPFSGVIGRRLVAPGEWVQTGTAVLELVATNPLRIDVRVPQNRFASIGSGASVEVRADGDGGKPIPARIDARVPVADPQARSFLVRVAVDDPPPTLTPGMSVSVAFDLAGDETAVAIPNDAVLRFPDGTTVVWVLSGQGEVETATRRAVKLGAKRGEDVTVLEGLAAGERVVVRGNERLKEGQRVTGRAFKAAAR